MRTGYRKSKNMIDARNTQSTIENTRLRSNEPMAKQKSDVFWNPTWTTEQDPGLGARGFNRDKKDPKPSRFKK